MKTKQLLVSLLINTVLFVVSYFSHYTILKVLEIELFYSLMSIYLYFFLGNLTASFIYFAVYKISPDSIGYLFLTLVMVKLGLFMLIFNQSLFAEIALNMTEKVSLLIPLFLFLVVESLLLSNSLQIKDKR